MAYLADRKPGELTALTTLDTDDVFIVGDTSDASEVAKHITKANLITDLTTSFAPALGTDDNYVTDAEKAAIGTIGNKIDALADPNADRILFWDDSAGAYAYLTASTGLTISTTSMTVRTSSATQTGIVELAIASEVNTGTDATRAVTPDALAGSNLGIRYVQCALNGTTALTTSEKCYFRVPAALTGMNLVSVAASVGTGAAGSSSSGTPTFTVKNVTDNQQMLSTSLTVDANEYTSATAATAAVINTTYDDVATDDLIEVAVTTAGTGVTYAVVTLGFQLP